jgi:hypothetical protein
MKQSTYLILGFIALAMIALILLSQSGRNKEGYKTGHTPPLDPNISMEQVKKGVSKLGHNGYIQSINDRIGSLEQKYPDVSEDE